MPFLNGFEFLKGIQKKPQIILVTSKEKYAVESYEYNINDYLLKPVSYARFLQAVNKVKKSLDDTNNRQPIGKELFVRVNSVIEKIKVDHILYIEAAVDYVEIFTSAEKFLVNTSMHKIIDKLPKDDFIRVHRSFIVRIDKINKIDGNLIEINNKLIRISKSYKDEVMRSINLI